MAATLNVLFKSMQKDDKKEVLKFEIKGNEDGAAEEILFRLSGSIVVVSMEVGGDDVCGELTAEFISMQRDSKKTVMKFGVKGESDEKAQKLYKFAGRNVELTVKPSQMTVEEFYDDGRDGLKYSVNGDGTVNVEKDQMSIDDVGSIKDSDEEPPMPDDKDLPF
ncbi:hypothetical protein ACFCP7_22940 [Paenibacillus elgii]